jgi:hypothetical protein
MVKKKLNQQKLNGRASLKKKTKANMVKSMVD